MATPSAEGVQDSGLGPLIRMRDLDVKKLPAHPDLASQQTAAPDVRSFTSSVLEEANAFLKTYFPHHFKVKAENKPSPPSTASVKLFSHDIKATDFPAELKGTSAGDEAWFARTSIHENQAKNGTASFEEFDGGLRVNHSEHERDYTPNVYDSHEVLNWDSELAGSSTDNKIHGYEEVRVYIEEMAHKIPSPMNNRVFTVLVITAKKEQEFLVVQIPVLPKGLPNAKYKDDTSITHGMYTSIELGELIENGSKVQWTMATASDAKGSLPMWMQKMGVPGAVVKDVGFFIEWCAKRRNGQKTS